MNNQRDNLIGEASSFLEVIEQVSQLAAKDLTETTKVSIRLILAVGLTISTKPMSMRNKMVLSLSHR